MANRQGMAGRRRSLCSLGGALDRKPGLCPGGPHRRVCLPSPACNLAGWLCWMSWQDSAWRSPGPGCCAGPCVLAQSGDG